MYTAVHVCWTEPCLLLLRKYTCFEKVKFLLKTVLVG